MGYHANIRQQVGKNYGLFEVVSCHSFFMIGFYIHNELEAEAARSYIGEIL